MCKVNKEDTINCPFVQWLPDNEDLPATYSAVVSGTVNGKTHRSSIVADRLQKACFEATGVAADKLYAEESRVNEAKFTTLKNIMATVCTCVLVTLLFDTALELNIALGLPVMYLTGLATGAYLYRVWFKHGEQD